MVALPLKPSLPIASETDVASLLHSLQSWTIEVPLPATVTAAQVQAATALMVSRLEPAGAQQFAVALARLFDFMRAFGTRDFDSDVVTAHYRAALGDIPADLMGRAVERIMAMWQWPSLPKPADLRKAVQAEMDKRTAAKNRLQTAAMRLRWDGRA